MNIYYECLQFKIFVVYLHRIKHTQTPTIMAKKINQEAAWPETCTHLHSVCQTACEALMAARIDVDRVYYEASLRNGTTTFVVRYRVAAPLSPFERQNLAARVQLVLSGNPAIAQWFPVFGLRSSGTEDGGTVVENDWQNEWE